MRVPLVKYAHVISAENRGRIGQQVAPTQSTFFTLEEFVQSDGLFGIHQSSKNSPLHYLFMIMLYDTLKVLQSVDKVLTGISEDMLDESIL